MIILLRTLGMSYSSRYIPINAFCRASLFAALVAATVTSPVDVVKTRIMSAKGLYPFRSAGVVSIA